MGGEEERVVSLTRVNTNESLSNAKNRHSSSYRSYHRPYHRPPLSYGVSILEFPPGDTHWKHGTCPYQKHHRTIESVDQGALYYRRYFFGQGKLQQKSDSTHFLLIFYSFNFFKILFALSETRIEYCLKMMSRGTEILHIDKGKNLAKIPLSLSDVQSSIYKWIYKIVFMYLRETNAPALS